MRFVRAITLGVALLALGVPAAPVAAGDFRYGYGTHTGNFGLHWILDGPGPDPELPAVRCNYGGGAQELRSMLIRQPVIFADVSDGPRTQTVGWRARIQYREDAPGPWSTYDDTSWSKASATGQYPADLLPKTFAFPSNVEQHQRYRVVYQLRWYAPNGTVSGRAAHWPYWYGSTSFTYDDSCPNNQAPQLAGPQPPYGEGPHTGKRGLHWILDHMGENPEYPAVTCQYDTERKLQRVRIRPPIAFARDTGDGVQAQDVAWHASIQITAQNTGQEDWTTIDQTSPTRDRASDRAWADFRPKSVEVGMLMDSIGVRVVYRLTWYRGSTNEVVGRAAHFPLWYLEAHEDGGVGWHEHLCYTQLPLG